MNELCVLPTTGAGTVSLTVIAPALVLVGTALVLLARRAAVAASLVVLLAVVAGVSAPAAASGAECDSTTTSTVVVDSTVDTSLAPATTTEPVVVTTTEPVGVTTTEPVVATTTEPVVVTTTEPVVVTTTEPEVIAGCVTVFGASFRARGLETQTIEVTDFGPEPALVEYVQVDSWTTEHCDGAPADGITLFFPGLTFDDLVLMLDARDLLYPNNCGCGYLSELSLPPYGDGLASRFFLI